MINVANRQLAEAVAPPGRWLGRDRAADGA
jgi:hypothetical protein